MLPPDRFSFRHPTLGLAALLFIVASWNDVGFAAPAYPGAIILQQPDGSLVEARVRGDEFHGWYETADGHPIERDESTKTWVYRSDPSVRRTMSASGATSSSGPIVVGEGAPPSAPWTPEETEEAAQLRQQADQARAEVLSSAAEATSPQAVPRMRTASVGPTEKKLLTICVRFSDSPPASALTPVSYFQEKIYSVTTDASAPKHTVADYYLEVSGNKLLVTGEAVGWIDLPYTKAQYGGPSPSGDIFDDAKLRMLIQNSVSLLGGQGFDFGPYDTDNDGFLDMLAIVFEGQGEADGGGPDTIWPHQYSYEKIWPEFTDGVPLNTGSTNAEGEDVFIDLYFTNSELNQSSAAPTKLVRAPIGTFCHEYAHALGLPDLYDRTVPKSSGLGKWSLMASGSYNQADGQAGDSPAWPDPYCRLLMGWDRQINVTASTMRARIPEAKGPDRAVYRVWSEGLSTPQEFLVETRKRTGFDRGLPGEGLLIYHVNISDDTVRSQNDAQWYLYPRAWTGQGHYLVALEQADGQFHLEQTQGAVVNRGDATDPYTTGGEFSDSTMPSSKAYPPWGEFGEGPSTHVALRNIDTSQPDASYADIYVFQDQEQPQVSITSPSDMGPPVAELAEATGTAFDNSAVSGIRAWLYEVGPGGRYYDWTNGSWRSDFTEETQKHIDPGTAWTLSLPALPDGTYRLSVAAQDATGLESPVAVSQFTIDGNLLNPSLAINSPSGETYAEPPLVQGTSATPENTALTERRFALYSETSGRWYNWGATSFDSASFDFAAHVMPLAGADTSWNFSLPAALSNGRYQIHAQSVNDRNRGAPWVSQTFVIKRTPSAALTSISHQALLQSMGSISGTATPQGSYLLTEIRITINRNGKYWNGTEWTDAQTYVTASVPPAGGAWSYAGTLPTADGLYAVSAVALDDQGSFSAPVAGGSAGQNNILFQIDATPPSVAIQWPPAGHVSTAQQIDAADITGTATDGSGRPAVRVRIKRLEDGLYWSRYGWTFSDANSWHQGSFPGGDGGSQVQWVMEASLPDSGADASWCMPNGQYELTVEARDAVGNISSATREFLVDYVNPLLVGVVETALLPAQQPIGPDPASISSSTFAAMSFSSSAGPWEAHAIAPLAGGKYGVTASTADNSLFYGYSSRQPYLISVGPGSAVWSTRITGPVAGEGGVFYQRVSSPPVVSFGSDGSAVVASGLMQLNSGSSRYDLQRQCEVVRLGPDGTEQWTRLVPPTAATEWAGGASASSLDVELVEILPDESSLLVCDLQANDESYFFGPTNYRNHIMVMLLDRSGTLQWTQRFGSESEDELLHENEAFLFLEPDGFGHVFLATRRITGTGPEQVLRKIRLADGVTVSEFVSDPCTAPETWGALTVDATGRPVIAGAMKFGENDARLSVQRLSANDLITDWQAYGPAQSAAYDASWSSPPEVPLVRVDGHGVTVVHNGPGANGTFGDGNDRIFVSRFGGEGTHQWSREVDAPSPSAPGSRAETAMVTAAGDVLLAGYFATGSFDRMRGYAKVSGNGDLQFVKNLADEFDLSGGALLAAGPATTGDQLAALYLNSEKTSLQVRLLDNPVNVVLPPDLDAGRPEDISVALGEAFTLEAVNTGSAAAFQWYRQTGEGSFEAIAGATSSRYTVASAAGSDAGGYRAVAVNGAGEATTRTAVVTVVTSAPVITSGLAVTAYTGEYFSYQIVAENSPSSFGIVFDPENYPDGISPGPAGSISGFPSTPGTYQIQITATNALGADTQLLILTVADPPVVSLGDALDASSLSWATATMPNDWFVQDYYTAVGTHAVWTYAAPGSTNWIEATITGPGTLAFWWGAYVGEGFADQLVLYLDGTEQASIGSSGYVQRSLEIPSGTHTVRWSLQTGPDGDGSTTGYLDGVSFAPSDAGGFGSWASENGLSGADAQPGAAPRGDGISNLLKYAFGMDPSVAQSGPGRHLEPGVGTSGLPDVRMENAGGAAKLRVEFVRRRGSAGIDYIVQFSGDLGPLGAWDMSTETPVITPINDEWERVVVQDQVTRGEARRRFARVLVTESP